MFRVLMSLVSKTRKLLKGKLMCYISFEQIISQINYVALKTTRKIIRVESKTLWYSHNNKIDREIFKYLSENFGNFI